MLPYLKVIRTQYYSIVNIQVNDQLNTKSNKIHIYNNIGDNDGTCSLKLLRDNNYHISHTEHLHLKPFHASNIFLKVVTSFACLIVSGIWFHI